MSDLEARSRLDDAREDGPELQPSGLVVDERMAAADVTPKVLVVDDDQGARDVLAEILRNEGFHAVAAADGEAAVHQVMAEPPAIVFLDLVMPGLDGMETLQRLKTLAPQVPVIMLTGVRDSSSVAQAMQMGADDYLTKPPQIDQLLAVARRSMDGHKSHQREDGSLRWLMGPSRQVENVIQEMRQVADSNFTILIQGETGTGKELVARASHQLSSRRERPFVAIDCGAIPETLIESELFGYEKGAFTGADRRKAGYFQLADGGSLFFDEIANLPLTTQTKLLRVLQERRVQPLGGRRPIPVNVRILAAYNTPLVEEIRAGRFRHDLYYRLNEFVIVLPPLRERQDDVPYLTKRFVTEASTDLRRPIPEVSEEAIEVLLRHPWPGNVRELRNVIRRAVLVAADVIRPEHLRGLVADAAAPPVPEPVDLSLSLREIAARATAEAEARAICHALEAAQGRKSEAARLLKTDYKTLHVKMKRYRISARQFAA